MNLSILQGTEHLSGENPEEFHSWFDSFSKTVPFQISSARLKRPLDPKKKEDLFITCKTPLRREVDILVEALDSGDETIIDRAVTLLQSSFNHLIEQAELPRKARIAGREIALTWVPEELSLFEQEHCSPQQQSIMERNLRTMVCLESVNMIMDSDVVFEDKWRSSNDPFLSAGLLATGDWVWIDKFISDSPSTKRSRSLLRERIGQNAGRYLMLLRLAQLAGYEGPLQKSWTQIKKFGSRVWLGRSSDQYWMDAILEGDSFSFDEMAIPIEDYMRLDQEVEMVGNLLTASIEGHEREIPGMIDMALAFARVPQPPLFRRWQE